MKVLHVIDAMGVGGGAEHSLATMLPLLRERGVESSVVCLLPREGGLQASLREQGFSVEVLSHGAWPKRIWALRQKILAASPDIVHATLFNSCLATRFACIGVKVARVDSLVNTSYDPIRVRRLPISAQKLWLYRFLDGVTARHLAGHFHAITQAVAREATQVLKVPPHRITIIPRGRSATQLGERSAARQAEARKRLDLDVNAPVLLNVGRQDYQKAQAALIGAFSTVLEEAPNAVLLIAGREGDATKEVRQALQESGLSDKAVRLLGHRTDVFDIYVAADIFVFPSLYEGLGCSVVEAMGLSTPVIGSDAPAVAEVLGHGEYGVIVHRGDVGALAKAILGLLADPARRSELAVRGYQQFERRYELERVADATLSMYESIL